MDGCAAARGASSPWGSCRLNPERPVVGLLELLHARAERRGRAVLGEVVLDEAQAQVVPGALREHLAAYEARRGAHAAGEILEAQAEAAGIEVTGGGTAQEGIQLAQAPILAAVVAQVLPRLEPRRDRLCRRDGGAFVRQQLAQCRPRAGLPVVVVAAQLSDEAPQIGATR